MTQKMSQLKKRIMNKPHLIIGLCLIPLFYSNSVFANKLHSHKQIRDTAIEFVRSQIPEDINIKKITAGKIDSRIQFKQCTEALEASSSRKKRIAKNWTISIRCYGETPWSIHIPIKAQLTRNMIVSKTTITRGEMITQDKIMLMEQEITRQNQKHFSDANNVTGREARRTISPKRVINSSMIQEAVLVHKKESVLIYAKGQKIQISMKGTALKNGRYNEMIKVRNNSSNKIIEAVVVDRGIVAVNF
ncbi:MAG: flagellar basal body P-ring formation chaperone FlgA [Gammaproteobacteria bacterium]|nr:flagellar basal body P-ring formation chaperone FlgA [Gammaproteobacteria bacterium]